MSPSKLLHHANPLEDRVLFRHDLSHVGPDPNEQGVVIKKYMTKHVFRDSVYGLLVGSAVGYLAQRYLGGGPSSLLLAGYAGWGIGFVSGGMRAFHLTGESPRRTRVPKNWRVIEGGKREDCK